MNNPNKRKGKGKLMDKKNGIATRTRQRLPRRSKRKAINQMNPQQTHNLQRQQRGYSVKTIQNLNDYYDKRREYNEASYSGPIVYNKEKLGKLIYCQPEIQQRMVRIESHVLQLQNGVKITDLNQKIPFMKIIEKVVGEMLLEEDELSVFYILEQQIGMVNNLFTADFHEEYAVFIKDLFNLVHFIQWKNHFEKDETNLYYSLSIVHHFFIAFYAKKIVKVKEKRMLPYKIYLQFEIFNNEKLFNKLYENWIDINEDNLIITTNPTQIKSYLRQQDVIQQQQIDYEFLITEIEKTCLKSRSKKLYKPPQPKPSTIDEDINLFYKKANPKQAKATKQKKTRKYTKRKKKETKKERKAKEQIKKMKIKNKVKATQTEEEQLQLDPLLLKTRKSRQKPYDFKDIRDDDIKDDLPFDSQGKLRKRKANNKLLEQEMLFNSRQFSEMQIGKFPSKTSISPMFKRPFRPGDRMGLNKLNVSGFSLKSLSIEQKEWFNKETDNFLNYPLKKSSSIQSKSEIPRNALQRQISYVNPLKTQGFYKQSYQERRPSSSQNSNRNQKQYVIFNSPLLANRSLTRQMSREKSFSLFQGLNGSQSNSVYTRSPGMKRK